MNILLEAANKYTLEEICYKKSIALFANSFTFELHDTQVSSLQYG